jgi:hypothetical protein
MEFYVYPTIISLPLGYDCTVEIPYELIGSRLHSQFLTATVIVAALAYRDGHVIYDRTYELNYQKGQLVGVPPDPFFILDQSEDGATEPGYVELSMTSGNNDPVFASKRVFGMYTIYSKTGKKSFLSDNSYKYGSPPVIAQIAKFGKFIDSYPVIHLDRFRNLGETLVLINPYKRPVLAKVSTFDARELPRIKIPAEAARNISLSILLNAGERDWAGHIQVTASNRLVTFSIKHSLDDITIISDHEHLDPYRSDPTHEAATLALRKWAARTLEKIGVWRPLN